MTCSGWWSAEATTFVSGYISETEQAVNGVGFQILQMLFMVSMYRCALLVYPLSFQPPYNSMYNHRNHVAS